MSHEIFLELKYVQGQGRRLRPASAIDGEAIDDLPDGEYRAVLTTTNVRSGGTKRKWYAGLGLLIENTEDPRIPTKEKAHELVMRGIGMTHAAPTLRGENFETQVIDTFPEAEDSAKRVLELARAFALAEWHFDPWQLWEDQKAANHAAKVKLAGGR